MVGNPCETFLCHTKLNDDYKPPRGRVIHMLQDGNMHEKDIVQRCINSGYQVLHSCMDKQLELHIQLNSTLNISGHPDGVLVCGTKTFDLDRADSHFKFGKSSYLLEVTAPNNTNFARLEKEGLEEQNYQKYVQSQLYMLADEVNNHDCILVAKNKNTTALYEEGISFRPEVITALIERLERVNSYVKRGSLSDYRCNDGRMKWCRYHALCFDRDVEPSIISAGILNGRSLKEVDQLKGLAAMWHKGKDLESESEELIEEVRTEFERIIADYGAEGIVIDDVKAKMTESHSTKCDYATLKLKAPELYDEVVTTKPTGYVRVTGMRG